VRDLDRRRLTDLFAAAFEAAAQQVVRYTYKDRRYRIRKVTVTVAEMWTPGGGWVPLPADLTDQLRRHISAGEAIETTERTPQ
jgi:hypothetical protein